MEIEMQKRWDESQTINRGILEMLKIAPQGNLVPQLEEKVREFDGNDEELLELFKAIYESPDSWKSDFVKQLVNPEFTSHPKYSEDK